MPELPEVEVVRRGLVPHVVGRVVASVQILHPRSVRRHDGGAEDLTRRLVGRTVTGVERRGKYLWLCLDDDRRSDALVVHLGMSGQMLVAAPEAPQEKHLRIRVRWRAHPGRSDDELRFVDQRTFGGWAVEGVREVDGTRLPDPVAHIARDPMDPAFDRAAAVTVLAGKHTEIKRALLDQTVVSGIGNIYADEALWRAELHGRRRTDRLRPHELDGVLAAATEVMASALTQGGTSFDALYVHVNGASGYFDRSLEAYGQAGLPCARCGTTIVREQFMNRGSFSCPRCQPPPR